MTIDAAVRRVAPAEEQAWNGAALEGGVPLPAVRVWVYREPAVVLGRTQHPDEAMSGRARAAGVTLVERPSGGGAVLAGPWLLGASVVLPPDHPLVVPSIPASYGWASAAHAAWLRDAGVPADPVPAPKDAGPLRWACFAGLSHGELTVGGRKIVGLAQARRRLGVLWAAGTLIDASPWETLAAVLDRPAAEGAALGELTTHMRTFGPVDPDALAEGLLAALRDKV